MPILRWESYLAVYHQGFKRDWSNNRSQPETANFDVSQRGRAIRTTPETSRYNHFLAIINWRLCLSIIVPSPRLPTSSYHSQATIYERFVTS